MPDSEALQQLLDRMQIGEVMATYTRCADLNLPEAQAETFVDECRVSYHPSEWIVGRAALIKALHTAIGRYRRTSHHISNIEIEFEGADAASAQSALIAWHQRLDNTEWTLYGRYVDRWVRTPDGWRMTERQLRAAGAAGRDVSELPPLGRA